MLLHEFKHIFQAATVLCDSFMADHKIHDDLSTGYDSQYNDK